MSVPFVLNHDRLSADPAVPAGFSAGLAAFERIDSPESFNRYCRTACRLWTEFAGQTDPLLGWFQEALELVGQGAPDTIRTGWGGVVVTLHEPPRVEKFLLVRRGGYLALEKHAEKEEHLEIRGGTGLLLSRQTPDAPLSAEVITPGKTFHFAPGREHCLIGVDDLLVFERGTDPKGMDQDLIFLYEPDGVA